MKNNKNYLMIIYAIVHILAIALTVIMDIILRAYRQFAFPAMLTYHLYMSVPILISILSFIKIMMQSKISAWFSGLSNIIIIVLFVIVIKFVYRPLGMVSFISTYNLTAFVFYLQLCSLAYDIFFRKIHSNSVIP